MSASAHAPIYISIIMWAAQGWSDPERIMSQSCDVVFYEQPFKEPRRIVTDSEVVPQISGHPDKWIRSQNQRVWTQDLSESTEVVVLSFLFFSFLQQTVSEINTFRVTGVELLLLLCSSVL